MTPALAITFPPDSAPGWEEQTISPIGALPTRVRPTPDTRGEPVAWLRARTPVRVNTEATVMDEELKWFPVVIHSARGWIRSDAFQVVHEEAPITRLRLRYVSQIDNRAQLRNNDCGIAAALDVWDYIIRLNPDLDSPMFSVDTLIPLSPLVGTDKPLTLSAIRNFMVGVLGIRKARVVTELTLERIVQEIDKGYPVIALVAYRYITPAHSFDGGHYLTVVGYGENGVWVNDPLHGSRELYLTEAQMNAALRGVTEVGASSAPYLGIVFS